MEDKKIDSFEIKRQWILSSAVKQGAWSDFSGRPVYRCFVISGDYPLGGQYISGVHLAAQRPAHIRKLLKGPISAQEILAFSSVDENGIGLFHNGNKEK
jgi:hypothetical protein